MDIPTFDALKPFLVLGFALGGVFATSGVGLVVLYRTTGVVNLAYGAIGATGALITFSIAEDWGANQWLAYLVCILFGGFATLIYGSVMGPSLAARDALTKAIATLGLFVILLGVMNWAWGPQAHSFTLPTTKKSFTVFDQRVNWTQVIAMAFPIVTTVVVALFLKRSKVGTAMRALANDRDITATLGVPVRRVEAAAWFGSGILCGFSGLLLSNLVGLHIVALSTTIFIPSLAAALIGRLRSLWVTLIGGFAIGITQSSAAAFTDLADYRNMTAFIFAIIALLYFAARGVTEERMS